MERTSRALGLTDFGDSHFLEPLRIFTEDMEKDTTYHQMGRWFHTIYTSNILKNRLLLADAWKKSPEVLNIDVGRPLIIIGLPRTGTSHLVNLLACDKSHRTLSFWEINRPAPAPNPKTYKRDIRRISGWFVIQIANYLAPNLKSAHELRLDGPEECILLLANSFRSQFFVVEYNVPNYLDWYTHDCDHRPAYREHKKQLQLLQSGIAKERWLLKAPTHLVGIEGLLETYPDAMIVQTHRSVDKILPSICSLALATRGLGLKTIDPALIGQQMLDHLAPSMARFMKAREKAKPGQFLDIMYHDLIRDPLAVVKQIYSHFGLPLSEETQIDIRRELNQSPKHKHGAHRYTLDQFNLSRNVIEDRFADYLNTLE